MWKTILPICVGDLMMNWKKTKKIFKSPINKDADYYQPKSCSEFAISNRNFAGQVHFF
ncbi:hypothetical protein J2S25_003404 [Mesobacillus stamsii]|uniref:Uncharacterized protein n=1 Tax=Mesobacillus stamsii TaxID=225347 RepID=A0ABU0G0N9_9BACI|nr:hypothetical protein [Mesobacillus stamsii]